MKIKNKLLDALLIIPIALIAIGLLGTSRALIDVNINLPAPYSEVTMAAVYFFVSTFILAMAILVIVFLLRSFYSKRKLQIYLNNKPTKFLSFPFMIVPMLGVFGIIIGIIGVIVALLNRLPIDSYTLGPTHYYYLLSGAIFVIIYLVFIFGYLINKDREEQALAILINDSNKVLRRRFNRKIPAILMLLGLAGIAASAFGFYDLYSLNGDVFAEVDSFIFLLGLGLYFIISIPYFAFELHNNKIINRLVMDKLSD